MFTTAPRPTCRSQTSPLNKETPSRLQAATSVFSVSNPARCGSPACAAVTLRPSPSAASAVCGLAAQKTSTAA
eukprot:3458844-Alexandrium_andersonii.AAC.1